MLVEPSTFFGEPPQVTQKANACELPTATSPFLGGAKSKSPSCNNANALASTQAANIFRTLCKGQK